MITAPLNVEIQFILRVMKMYFFSPYRYKSFKLFLILILILILIRIRIIIQTFPFHYYVLRLVDE